jgi:Mg2+ and Co2+ transporter CorA
VCQNLFGLEEWRQSMANSSLIKMRMKDLNDEIETLNSRMNLLTDELENLDKVLRDYSQYMIRKRVEQRGEHGEEKQDKVSER